MIKKFELLGLHTVVDNDVRTYANNKLASLDQYIPRHSRNSAHLEVRLREEKKGSRVQAICEAILHLPRRTISLTERADSIFAAIDAVKTCLKLLIQKYKNEFTNNKRRRHLAARDQQELSVRGLGSEPQLVSA